MKRTVLRSGLTMFVLLVLLALPGSAEVTLPSGAAPKPIDFSHFPDRMHAFIWRNWKIVPVEQLAEVLGASVEQVQKVADSMGLPSQGKISSEWKDRGYITILRRNWHLLPYEQLLLLLDKTPKELHQSLLEDDFLFWKLGAYKPQCEPLVYHEPDAKAQAQAAWIKKTLQEELPDAWTVPEEPRFLFVDQPSRSQAPQSQVKTPQKTESGVELDKEAAQSPLRYIYAYCGIFGDPLDGDGPQPYTNGQLERLAEKGVTGVWLHTALHDLAPGGKIFPEFGAGHENRLAVLRDLVKRADKYHVKVYLYMNEPRGMTDEFYTKSAEREAMRGVQEGIRFAMCTSNPNVLQWMEDSLAYVFKNVPGLGGVFTITASENLTSCASHFQQAFCPRCKNRSTGDIIVEVNSTIERGVHRGSPTARVIAWDWWWPDSEVEQIIAKLPKNISIQSVSEWSKPITRGGVPSVIGEYSISAVGPGPRAIRNWELARAAGLKTLAKVQVNNTWELAAVPYLPVFDLVAQHIANLREQKVNGLMLSWSLGGYASPNLEIVKAIYDAKASSKDEIVEKVLQDMAEKRYGKSGAEEARAAWRAFSKAFTEFPYGVPTLYNGPQNSGPANLLFARSTGYKSTMVCFPYDDLQGWRGVYPPEVLGDQFRKVAQRWETGLEHLEKAVAASSEGQRDDVLKELSFARAAGLHFAAAANQVEYLLARDQLAKDEAAKPEEKISPERRVELEKRIRAAITRELACARSMFACARSDSHIGYEASNQYFYIPIDLAEKVINCRYLLEQAFYSSSQEK